MQNEFYREFYQTAMILAGVNDKLAFIGTHSDQPMPHSHFLIGLQGRQAENQEYFNWAVAIFKADSSGLYDAFAPLYFSAYYDKFDDAVEAARMLEKEVRSDQLNAVLLQEKIS